MSNLDVAANKSALKKKFFNYLLPSVAAMWVYSIYTMADGIFVGRGVGSSALAAVNIAMPFVNLIFACSMLFSTGASTIISIYLGQNKNEKANEVFTFNIISMICFSLIIMIFSLLNLDKISLFLGATDTTIHMVKDYLRIIICFNGFFIVSYCLEVLTKTDGFPQLAIIGVVLSAITNIILDYIFVIHFQWGVKGAAFATGISQVASTIFFTFHFFRSASKLNFVKFKFDFSIIRRVLSIGFPDAITELTSGIVILLFNQSILRNIGESGIVTYSIICYVSTLVLMTMIGITQGMQPLTSFYYGKEDEVTIKKLLNMAIKSITFASILVFGVSMLFTKGIVGVFISSDNLDLFNYSVKAFRIYSFSFLIVGYNILISGFCASLEKPLNATLISLLRGFVLVSIVLFGMVQIFGGSGIWYVTIISEGLCLFVSMIILRKLLLKNINKDTDTLHA